MTKMNWDRVRDQDRVRGGRSDMELADDREEQWLEREREREREREDRRQDQGATPPPLRGIIAAGRLGQQSASRSKKPAPARPDAPRKAVPKPAGGPLTKGEIAGLLGVTPGEVEAARVVETKASSGLTGVSKGERLRFAGRRLGITPEELTLLRKALAGHVSSPQRAAAALRTALRHAPTGSEASTTGKRPSATKPKPGSKTSPAPAGRAGPPKSPSKPKPGRTPKRSSGRPAGGATSASPVYVTKWGNVVHLYWDCPNARGFRQRGEPDADVFKVTVGDPCCRGRRVCATCKNGSGVAGADVERKLRSLHGKAFDESDWERHGWARPMPKGAPINRR